MYELFILDKNNFLVPSFNGILNCVGYLMTKPSL